MNKNLWFKTVMLASSSLLSLQLAAAPGTLIDLPLDVSREVQPNVLFLLDDSGSMSWSQLISVEGQPFVNSGGPNGRTNDTFAMPPTDQVDSDEKCVRYNLLAYDPTVKYEPWLGKDSANVPVPYVDLNLTLTSARKDPYLPATTDISDHLYTSFVDANTNNTLNAGECGTFTDFIALEVGYRIEPVVLINRLVNGSKIALLTSASKIARAQNLVIKPFFQIRTSNLKTKISARLSNVSLYLIF